jgi:predicted metal-dependent peptidase
MARGGDVVRPSLYTQLPEILVVVDSSGSMSKDDLAIALREASAAIGAAGVDDAWFLEVDADVQGLPRRVRAADLKKVELRGRGGTDFRPAFEAAKRLEPNPAILLYFTDGDGSAPETPPRGMQTAWVLVGKGYGAERSVPAPWGFVLRTED